MDELAKVNWAIGFVQRVGARAASVVCEARRYGDASAGEEDSAAMLSSRAEQGSCWRSGDEFKQCSNGTSWSARASWQYQRSWKRTREGNSARRQQCKPCFSHDQTRRTVREVFSSTPDIIDGLSALDCCEMKQKRK